MLIFNTKEEHKNKVININNNQHNTKIKQLKIMKKIVKIKIRLSIKKLKKEKNLIKLLHQKVIINQFKQIWIITIKLRKIWQFLKMKQRILIKEII